ncbi:DUF4336 domain-containing protein [Endothiovibrio diazotrophicus]
MTLQPAGEGIWTYEGETVSFYGFPFPTRMTVVRLADGGLWIHSPERIGDGLREALAGLGEVRHLVSPNKLHHLFLAEWLAAYPEATSWSSPGLREKRGDLRFDAELEERPPPAWAATLDQTIFRGSPAMEEAVFLHRPSRTLILTDLIENFDPATLSRPQRLLARFAGILAPHGRMPVDWRVSFRLGSRQRARESLARILEWEFENIVLSHGRCVRGGGKAFFERAFRWLG